MDSTEQLCQIFAGAPSTPVVREDQGSVPDKTPTIEELQPELQPNLENAGLSENPMTSVTSATNGESEEMAKDETEKSQGW